MTDWEEDAIRRAVDGDSTEFQLVLMRQCARLTNRLRGTIPSDLTQIIDVDDVVQETCLRAIRELPKLKWQGLAAFEGWMNQLAQNSLIDLVRAGRRKKRRGEGAGKRLSWIDFGELLRAGEKRGDQRPSEPARRRELIEAITTVVNQLPKRERAAVELYYLQQMPAQEAAEKLATTPGAFRALLQRARTRMQLLLHDSDWL